MHDTISRKLAINVADMTDYTGLAIEDVKKVTDEVIKGLKQLSPAPLDFDIIEKIDKAYDDGYKCGYLQAKFDYKVDMPSEIIRCKDCKHRPILDEDEELHFPTYKCPCQCEDYYYSWMPKDDWFCGNGERK